MELDGFMRAHAHVQDHIGRPKAAGLERFPFSDFDANSAWLAPAGLAADLVRWFQLLRLRCGLHRAEPRAPRWWLWHALPCLVRSARRTILRVQGSWPDAKALLGTHRRVALLS